MGKYLDDPKTRIDELEDKAEKALADIQEKLIEREWLVRYSNKGLSEFCEELHKVWKTVRKYEVERIIPDSNTYVKGE